MESFYAYVLIGFIVTILLFLLFREVVCWYFKINEKISLQQKTNELLENLINKIEGKEIIKEVTNEDVIISEKDADDFLGV